MIVHKGFGPITVEIKLTKPVRYIMYLLSSIARIHRHIKIGFLRAVYARYEN